MDEIKNELKSIKSSIDAFGFTINSMDSKVQDVQNSIDKMANEFEPFKVRVEGDIKSIRETTDLLTNDMQDTKGKIDTVANSVLSMDTKVQEVRKSIDKITNEFEPFKVRVEEDITSIKNTTDLLTNDLQDTKVKIDTVANSVDEIEGLSAEEIKTLIQTEIESHEDNNFQHLASLIHSLQLKLAAVEKSSHRGNQNSRKFNIEIDGIPSEVGDDPAALEEAALKIFASIGAPMESDDIDAIHRLPSSNVNFPKPTIVRIASRKKRDKIISKKLNLKHLSELDLNIRGLRNDSEMYIKPNLCPYYKTLAYNCRMLKKKNFIAGTSVDDDGTIKIKTNEGRKLKIIHELQLRQHFKEYRDFNFDYR